MSGYYRDLGVPTDATKRQIADAYRDRNGPASTHLTMIVKTLLDPRARADYDAMAIGSRFFDQEEADDIRRRIATKASEMMSSLSDEERRRLVEAEAADEMTNMLADRLDLDLEGSETWRAGWGWSYLQLRSRCDDTAKLAQWQALLMQAWSEVYSHVVHIAVGFVADQPMMVIPDGSRTILLLGDRAQPTLPLAREAVGRVPDSAS